MTLRFWSCMTGTIYSDENDWKRSIFIKDYQTFILGYDKFNISLIHLCGCLNDTVGYTSLQLKEREMKRGEKICLKEKYWIYWHIKKIYIYGSGWYPQKTEYVK